MHREKGMSAVREAPAGRGPTRQRDATREKTLETKERVAIEHGYVKAPRTSDEDRIVQMPKAEDAPARVPWRVADSRI